MDLKEYISRINKIFQAGGATEHSYRGALAEYIQSILGNESIVMNEPSRIACGAPDYVVMRANNSLPVFYIEAKDVGDSDLDGNKAIHKEQFGRYKSALGRIVFTDYLDFHFYINGEWIVNVRIGDIHGNRIDVCMEAQERFENIVREWGQSKAQGIKGAGRLASAMASKARLLRYVTFQIMNSTHDEDTSQMHILFNSFKNILIADLDNARFADMYAQTLVYGLFAARLNDTTPDDFSRGEAVSLIPKTNPFLRTIFSNIAGPDLDERIAWIVDDLVDVFAVSDVKKLMGEYGRDSKCNDPMVHFYEDFLKEYDPQLRKDMGVWYTPKPVVNFIVQSVDIVLKNGFGFRQGLADRSKTEIDVAVEGSTDKRTKDKKKHVKKNVHRVQILDPATGTGTFLAEVVRRIHDTVCKDNAGLWNEYVETDLKPRLNGFELMVAPYTIAHIKLDMVLADLDFDRTDGKRLKVFLADSLEEPSATARDLFNAISVEANEADKVKRDMPVMVVVGNPPYNGESRNNSEWIKRLTDSYKKEPGGKVQLNERNPKWLNDDYVKFIRMAQHYVERNGKGIVSYICPHGFLDNPTFRGMRWHLLHTFDCIYVLNLHGNSKKREVCPDGSKDENVFNIMQGVCICIFVKNGVKDNDGLGRVYYSDLWGTKKYKLQFLQDNDFASVKWTDVKIEEPMYFFVPKNFMGKEEYEKGFAVNELFVKNSVGVVTTKDAFLVSDVKDEIEGRLNDLIKMSTDELRKKYGLKDTSDWTVERAKNDVGNALDTRKICKYDYRPFDKRWIYYSKTPKGIIARPRYDVQKELRNSPPQGNIALLTCRQSVGQEWTLAGVSENITDFCRLSNKTKECGYVFPLYIINTNFGKIERIPNFSETTYNAVCDKLGMKPSPEHMFYYIYAVLHSRNYREAYKEFLKIDFPRIPYPEDKELFEKLTNLGGRLVEMHLMWHSEEWNTEHGFPIAGGNMVETIRYKDGGVYINSTQYFSNVDEQEWVFMMGSYQPAQKWLKDRKGKKLQADDIVHYEQMLYAIRYTLVIMDEIDEVI